MTREEVQAEWWKRLHELFKIDPHKYFYDKPISTYGYEYQHPGISPMTVHWQMFRTAVEKLASEE